MTYLLVVLAAVGAFLWTTPARDTLVANFSRATHGIEQTLESGREPIAEKIASASDYLREKAMELLRKELHRSVDGLVK